MATTSASNSVDGQEKAIVQDHDEQQYILRVGWKALFGFTTKKHLPVLSGALLCASIAAATMPVFAIVYGLIFREYTNYGAGKIGDDELLRGVTRYCIILAGVASLNWVANSFYFFLFLTFGELQARSARNRIFDALIEKDMAWFDTRETGIAAFLPAVQMHIRDLQLSVSAPFGEGVQCIVQGLAALGVAFYYSWNLTLVIICSVPLVYLIQAFLSSRLSIQAHEQANKLQQALKYITSAVKHIETVKCFNGERYELQSFTTIAASAAYIYRHVANLRSVQIGVMQFFTLSVFFQGFWYGNHLIKSGNINVGQVLTTFWAALMAIQGITGFLPQFIVLQTGKLAGAQLRVLLEHISKSDQRQESHGLSKPGRCLGDIEIQKVTFSYPTRADDVAILDISLFLPAGETTFIIGKSGSGKSTLGQLLVRFYQPLSGQIYLDGVPLDDLDVKWLRKNVTLVEQHSTLFNDTIRANVALGRIGDMTSFSDVQVRNAIKFAMLEPTIQELPEGLDTHVGMQGNSLSGGQKQRLALARARVRDSPVLILDESTSALDYVTRAAMLEGIRKWRKGKTTIVITHDISQIQPTDFVYLLDSTHLVQEGYRKELEANSGPFQSFLTSHRKDQTHEETEKEDYSDRDEGDAIIFCDPGIRSHSPMRRPLSAVLFGENVLQPFFGTDRGSLGETVITNSKYEHSPFDPGEEVYGSRRSSISFASVAFKAPPGVPSSAPGAFQLLESGSRRSSQASQRIHALDPHLRPQLRPLLTPSTSRSGSRASSRPASRQTHQSRNCSITDVPITPSKKTRRLERASSFLPQIKLAKVRNNAEEKTISVQSLRITEILKSVWPVLDWRRRFILCASVFCAVVHSAATPIFAWVFAQLLTTYYEPGDQTRRALIYASSILGIAVIDGVAYYLMFFLSDLVAQSWALALKTEAMRRILLQPREFFDREENSISRLAETLDHFAEEARNLPGRFACIIFVVIFMITMSIVWSLVTSWKLALVALATGPILYGITQCYNAISSRWERLSNEADDNVGELLHETFVNIRTVRCLVLESHFRKKFREKTAASVNVGIKRALYSGAIFGLNFAGILFIATLLFWYGATLISSNQYTVTEITEAFLILLLSVNHVALMTNYMTQVNISRDAGARLLRLARLPTTSHELDGTTQLHEAGDIRLNNVNFSYPSRKDFPVLNDVSFRIPKGSCTAIVGSSGSGKSTIAALLLKLYRTEPSIFNIYRSPDLTISNHDIKTLHTMTLRSRMAIVSQTPVLFPGTIAQNIIYGLSPSSPLAATESIRGAAEAAGVADFIDSLPHGYQTLVGDGGTTLSGGQAQRLAIARALVRDPDILILDEATSALDAVSASVIRDTILSLVRHARPPLSPIESSPVTPADGLWGGQNYFGVGAEVGSASAKASTKARGKMRRKEMTVIIITHARDMMAIAEHVIMLDKGRVVEEGSYQELKRKRGGAFKRLLRGENYDV